MNKHLICFLFFLLTCIIISSVNLQAQQSTYSNPVIPGEFADPTIIQVGDSWYAAGTSSEWAPYYPLYQSNDLVNWIQLGYVFEEQPEWTSTSFWAPELFYYNNKIYVYYTARNKAGVSYIGVAVAEDTNFNFVDYGIVVEWGSEAIDAFILEDKGDLYISWKAYGLDERPIELIACKLSKDGLRMEGEPFSLMRDDDNIGMEGQHWFKKGDYYYMLYSVKGCCGPRSDYEVYVARSKDLKGPYEIYDQNPILSGNGKDILSCGHGTFTELADGKMFYLYHAYLTGVHFYVGRQGMLQELIINENNWSVFTTGSYSQVTQNTPFAGTVQKPIVPFKDEFNSSTLNPQWSWNYPYATSDIKIKDGKLYLTGTPKGENKSGTALCVRPIVPDYSYTTRIASGGNQSFKGVTFYGDADNMIMLGVKDVHLQIKEIKAGQEKLLFEKKLSTTNPELKIDIKNGTFATFSWKNGNGKWEIASDIENMDLAPFVRWDRVARPGLIHQGPEGDPAIFDYFIMEYK